MNEELKKALQIIVIALFLFIFFLIGMSILQYSIKYHPRKARYIEIFKDDKLVRTPNYKKFEKGKCFREERTDQHDASLPLQQPHGHASSRHP